MRTCSGHRRFDICILHLHEKYTCSRYNIGLPGKVQKNSDHNWRHARTCAIHVDIDHMRQPHLAYSCNNRDVTLE